jgi:hypothetical protein
MVGGFDKVDWYLKVNNSSIFMKINPCDPISVYDFNTGMVCLQKTIERLLNAKTVKTEMTVSVMDKRNKMANHINKLHM